MPDTAVSVPPTLADTIRRDGFAFVEAPAMEALFRAQGLTDWAGFARSWDDLGLDTYMADGGRYRRRRHATFAADAAGIRRKPHQPHYQSRDYNSLNGGIERWFAPVTDETAAHPAMQAILRTCHDLFGQLAEAKSGAVRSWHVEIHQFRIEARPDQTGKPTPEGMHRDGVDYVLVLMIDRANIARGETSIHDLERKRLGSFTLTRPMDAALVDDLRVYHGVTPVAPLDPALPAHRDVLVVTFRRDP